MKNFKKVTITMDNREELHNVLNLTGCDVSVNKLPAMVAVPFVHAHTNNEELYIVLEGKGELYIDGEVVEIAKGDAFRIDPEGHRAIRALETGLQFICIQTRKNSLQGFTAEDAKMCEDKAPWH